MKRKALAMLLCAILAVQPTSVVLAEDLLSSGSESTETAVQEGELSWSLEFVVEGTAEVVGTGVYNTIPEFAAKLNGYIEKYEKVDIPTYQLQKKGEISIPQGYEKTDVATVSKEKIIVYVKPIIYEISVSSSDNNAGTVSGGGSYKTNERVTVTAEPNLGYHFVKWIENGVDVSTDASYTFSVSGVRNLTAVFETCTWGDWEIVYDATCEKEGLKRRYCKAEGCNGIEEAPIILKEHIWNAFYTTDKQATCVTEGKKSIHCSECDTIKPESETTIPVLEHDWDEGEVIEHATCTKEGKKLVTCKRESCGATETVTIPKTRHTWESAYTTDKQATCVTEGSRSIHCSTCNAVKPGSVTTIPAKGHLWDEGVITKEPTCTEPGIRTCTCERCKWTLQKEVAPKEHTYEGNVTKATFEKDGTVSGVCKDCGDKIQKEVIPQVTKIELSNTEYTYNSTNRQPKVVLKDRNGKELKAEEYSVVYPEESRRPGTYEVTITLKGNYYEGSLTKEYTVKKGNQVIGLEDMTKRIDSKTVTLKAQILQGNKTGRFGYKSSNPEVASVTSWGRVTFHKVGKAEITAMTRGNANYNGAQKTITLTVAPAPTAITKLQSQNPGWLNIQYRANPDADGYQIQYGTSPDMKEAKYAAVKNAAIRSYTRTDAKSGEKYYVRVRTYNVVDGERIYSNWSGIKSIDVK